MNAETIASLATAAGTLVLAVATFSSTRSANRSARVAERALQTGLRPVLMHARLDDGRQKIGFADQRWLLLEGPAAAIEVTDEAIYIAAPLRNVGTGLAILEGWYTEGRRTLGDEGPVARERFTMQTRDIYIPGGDLGFWQAALRDASTEQFAAVHRAVTHGDGFSIDLLYSDVHGAQESITRLALSRTADDRWMVSVGRHWHLPAPTTRGRARR